LSEIAAAILVICFPHHGQSGVVIGLAGSTGAVQRERSCRPVRFFSNLGSIKKFSLCFLKFFGDSSLLPEKR
jgi:hypothetical protein